ncbi:hypothetical protein [Mycolicibacterium sp. YH-1]|uniref:hypothetical protein n=1 Tax=Mycolicibacterium sp. YH-1 TaxID=2908837 RepID=UPI001F4BE771|nr:hypothetical protein [Mycolicibacterium sp. YH-1]UNB54541.1 hypothetical protein L0M16_09575 [Mycolicibacterium sp. YH-1]
MSTLEAYAPLTKRQQQETRERLVQTARDLLPLLRANADESERQRCLTDETTRALRDSGLMQALTPRRSGGAGDDVHTMIELTAELSLDDSSAGWVALHREHHGVRHGAVPGRRAGTGLRSGSAQRGDQQVRAQRNSQGRRRRLPDHW